MSELTKRQDEVWRDLVQGAPHTQNETHDDYGLFYATLDNMSTSEQAELILAINAELDRLSDTLATRTWEAERLRQEEATTRVGLIILRNEMETVVEGFVTLALALKRYADHVVGRKTITEVYQEGEAEKVKVASMICVKYQKGEKSK